MLTKCTNKLANGRKYEESSLGKQFWKPRDFSQRVTVCASPISRTLSCGVYVCLLHVYVFVYMCVCRVYAWLRLRVFLPRVHVFVCAYVRMCMAMCVIVYMNVFV